MRRYRNRATRNPRWLAGEAIEGQAHLWSQQWRSYYESRRKPAPVRVIMKDGVLVDPPKEPKSP